jgi:GNAT superfamily N-acetyltransferase
MAGLTLRTSDVACVKEVTEAALDCLHRHTVESNGVLMEDKPFSVLAFMEERLAGGLIGKVFWNWLYADLVWVEEEFRRCGIGTQVMRAAEERALQMKLTGIYLWTEAWQAPSFYKNLGYSQFVEFENFPPGHSRLGFRKYLA